MSCCNQNAAGGAAVLNDVSSPFAAAVAVQAISSCLAKAQPNSLQQCRRLSMAAAPGTASASVGGAGAAAIRKTPPPQERVHLREPERRVEAQPPREELEAIAIDRRVGAASITSRGGRGSARSAGRPPTGPLRPRGEGDGLTDRPPLEGTGAAAPHTHSAHTDRPRLSAHRRAWWA